MNEQDTNDKAKPDVVYLQVSQFPGDIHRKIREQATKRGMTVRGFIIAALKQVARTGLK